MKVVPAAIPARLVKVYPQDHEKFGWADLVIGEGDDLFWITIPEKFVQVPYRDPISEAVEGGWHRRRLTLVAHTMNAILAHGSQNLV